jgi:hypothetical protein
MREMSAPQFFAEFGGGSVDLVRWHFRTLAAYGWLRKVKTAEPTGGPGRPPHLYRATEVALIDTETWVTLPLSVRSVFSGRILDQLWDQIGCALKADTFDSRDDRHLTWTPVLLDEQGWKERGQDLAECFRSLQHEQDDAKIRLQASGEKPILMTVALAAFESPGGPDGTCVEYPAPIGLPPLAPPPPGLDLAMPESKRIAKAFSDPLNLKIITELNIATMSATQLQAKIGGASVFSFDRRCKMLAEMGWIVHVHTKTGGRRRGANEIFYRAVGPLYLDTEMWGDIGEEAKPAAVGRSFSSSERRSLRRWRRKRLTAGPTATSLGCLSCWTRPGGIRSLRYLKGSSGAFFRLRPRRSVVSQDQGRPAPW